MDSKTPEALGEYDMRNGLFVKPPRRGAGLRPGRQGRGGGHTSPRASGVPPPQGKYGGGDYGAPDPYQSQPAQSQARGGGRGGILLRPAKVADKTLQNQLIFSNICAVSPRDFGSSDGQDVYLRLYGPKMRGDFVVTARPVDGFPDGSIALSDPQRSWCGVGMMDDVYGEPYEPFSQGAAAYVSTANLEVGFASRKISDTMYDQDELAARLIATCQNQVIAPGQRLLLDVSNVVLSIEVKTVTLVDLSMERQSVQEATSSEPTSRGILTNQANLNFIKKATSPIKLKASANRPAANPILAPDFKFEDMGIGGLDDEFSIMFRRAFASRLLPPGLAEQMGIKHVKGMLLYGPPGTGKTLIARQIGKMLNAREPKIINGPEVLNKYVGQSEENIRKLFADAEKESKERGDESGLHIIIFDELDAVCKQRGSGAGGGTGVGDSVVNQLLSKLDGVEPLNNILLIGMTNRLDMIDEALVRPGRLELRLEIRRPDEDGRLSILKIILASMIENGLLEPDVDLRELAARTKNFTGAELSGLHRSASSFAMMKWMEIGTTVTVHPEAAKKFKVSREDFLNALDEVKPAFGNDALVLEAALARGIIHFSRSVKQNIDNASVYAEGCVFEQVRPLSVLLHGPQGAGKTALAAHIALHSTYPHIKVISPAALIKYHDANGRAEFIRSSFADAYKSPASIIILDDLEGLIEWVPLGARLNTTILQTINTLLATPPPKGYRMFIMATTSRYTVMDQLDMASNFEHQLPIEAVADARELATVLNECGAFPNKEDVSEVINLVGQQSGKGHVVGVSVKKILTLADAAQAATKIGMEPKAWFAEHMAAQIRRG